MPSEWTNNHERELGSRECVDTSLRNGDQGHSWYAVGRREDRGQVAELDYRAPGDWLGDSGCRGASDSILARAQFAFRRGVTSRLADLALASERSANRPGAHEGPSGGEPGGEEWGVTGL